MKKLIRFIFLLSISLNSTLNSMDPPDLEPPKKKQKIQKNKQDKKEPRDIFKAVKFKNHQALRDYLEAGGRPLAQGYRLLIEAAVNGDMKALEILLAYGCDFRIQGNVDTGFPTHLAIEYGHEEVAKWLIERGIDPNVFSEKRSTLFSASYGAVSVEFFNWLVNHGAEIDVADFLHQNSMHHIVSCYADCEPNDLLLSTACEKLQILFEHGNKLEDVDHSDRDNCTPLFNDYAGRFSCSKFIVRWLIEHGANMYAESIHDTLKAVTIDHADEESPYQFLLQVHYALGLLTRKRFVPVSTRTDLTAILNQFHNIHSTPTPSNQGLTELPPATCIPSQWLFQNNIVREIPRDQLLVNRISSDILPAVLVQLAIRGNVERVSDILELRSEGIPPQILDDLILVLVKMILSKTLLWVSHNDITRSFGEPHEGDYLEKIRKLESIIVLLLPYNADPRTALTFLIRRHHKVSWYDLRYDKRSSLYLLLTRTRLLTLRERLLYEIAFNRSISYLQLTKLKLPSPLIKEIIQRRQLKHSQKIELLTQAIKDRCAQRFIMLLETFRPNIMLHEIQELLQRVGMQTVTAQEQNVTKQIVSALLEAGADPTTIYIKTQNVRLMIIECLQCGNYPAEYLTFLQKGPITLKHFIGASKQERDQMRRMHRAYKVQLLWQAIDAKQLILFDRIFILFKGTLSPNNLQELLKHVAMLKVTEHNYDLIKHTVNSILSTGLDPSAIHIDQVLLIDYLEGLLEADQWADRDHKQTKILQRRQEVIDLLKGQPPEFKGTALEDMQQPQQAQLEVITPDQIATISAHLLARQAIRFS